MSPTGGIERALEMAKEAANGQDVRLWGGSQAINQYMAAGLLDVLELHVVPVLLGGGARLFENLGGADVRLEQVRAVGAPGVTHVKYRVRSGSRSIAGQPQTSPRRSRRAAKRRRRPVQAGRSGS